MLDFDTVAKRTHTRSGGVASLKMNLRQLRNRAGLTQDELAERSGVDQSTISQMENGRKTDASTALLGQLADALGVTVHDLVYDWTRSPIERVIEEFRASDFAKELSPPFDERDATRLRGLGPGMTKLGERPTMLGVLLVVKALRDASKPLPP